MRRRAIFSTREVKKGCQAVWLIDLTDGSTKAVLGKGQLLEGVSDTVLAAGKMYVAEGNVAQLLAGEEQERGARG